MSLTFEVAPTRTLRVPHQSRLSLVSVVTMRAQLMVSGILAVVGISMTI